MHVIVNTLIEVILIALNLYWYVILASVIVLYNNFSIFHRAPCATMVF